MDITRLMEASKREMHETCRGWSGIDPVITLSYLPSPRVNLFQLGYTLHQILTGESEDNNLKALLSDTLSQIRGTVNVRRVALLRWRHVSPFWGVKETPMVDSTEPCFQEGRQINVTCIEIHPSMTLFIFDAISWLTSRAC